MQSNITFSSGIYFVPKSTLNKMASGKTTKFIGECNGMEGVKKVPHKAYTKKIMHCISGVLKGDNEFDYMAHFYPQNSLNKYSEIEKTINKMPEEKEQKGLILGGTHFINEIFAKSSRQGKLLANKLKTSFKKFKNNDFTIFLGQQKNNGEIDTLASEMLYDKTNDKYFISINTFGTRNDEKIFTPQEIKDYFKYINISDNDQVHVTSKKRLGAFEQIPNSFFNKGVV